MHTVLALAVGWVALLALADVLCDLTGRVHDRVAAWHVRRSAPTPPEWMRTGDDTWGSPR